MTKNLLQSWLKALYADRSYICLSYCLVGVALTAAVGTLEATGVSVAWSVAIAVIFIPPLQFLVFVLQRNRLAESFWIFRGSGKYAKLRFESEFKRDIAAWPEGTLSTVYFGCEVLMREYRQDFIQRHKNEILQFLDSCYDSVTGFHRRNLDAGRGSAYDSNCAIGIMKSLYGVPCNGSLGLFRADRVLGQRTSQLTSATVGRARNILSGNVPNRDRTLVELYACYSILRNLEEIEVLTPSQDSLLLQFIQTVMVPARTGKATAFKIAPDHEEPCVNATYFALRLLRLAHIDPASVTSPEQISNFIYSCWHEDVGGFSSIPTSAPTLVHSKMALDVLKFISNCPSGDHLAKLVAFVRACRDEDGFAFQPGMLRNTYAARCALDIIEELRRLGQPSDTLSELKATNLAQAVIDQFYDPLKGLFRGYPSKSGTRVFLQESA